MKRNRTGRLVGTLLTLVGLLPIAAAAEVPTSAPGGPGQSRAWTSAESAGRTPPRLSYVTGEVSFWRPGAEEWAPAKLNTALAPGDYLYSGPGANLELQVDGRAFVRAAGETQLGLASQEPDSLQLTVSGGLVALDLRELPAGYSIEIGTSAGALTIDQPGYYLADVQPTTTAFTIERGGRATVTVANGSTQVVGSGQHVALRSGDHASVETSVAPQPSDWDRWNYARTDALLASQSARHVPLTMYGGSELDRYGAWRVEAEYGPVWVPQAQPADWAPYSSGRWMWDPYYGWTWVDDAPWGWAPYHYGRWVFLDRAWAWAPGPVIVHPAYSPALVAFFGHGGGFITGGPIGWIALGWGEPLIPWWGPVGFVGRPCWIGWSGPRVVNNVVINNTTVVNVTEVNIYRNTRVHNAVVAVAPEHFGTRHLPGVRIPRVDLNQLNPMASVPIRPTAASFVGSTGRAARPPARLDVRPVVTRRGVENVGAPGGPATRRHDPDRALEPQLGAPGARPDPVIRSSGRTFGEPIPPTTRHTEPRVGAPRGEPVPPPPPGPMGRPAELERRGARSEDQQVIEPQLGAPGARPDPAIRSSGRTFGEPILPTTRRAEPERESRFEQFQGDRRPITMPPAGVPETPNRSGGREGPNPPRVRETPNRVVIPPQVRPPAAGGNRSGIETPPASNRDWQLRGGPVATPEARVERRVDWPQARRENPARQPAHSTPTPGAFHPRGAPHQAHQAPSAEWTRGQQITQPASRTPFGNHAGSPRTTGAQGQRSFGSDREQRGPR